MNKPKVSSVSDWEPLIPEMEKVAEENSVMEVILSDDEYDRLNNGGLEELKGRVSENLFHRMMLFEKYPDTRGKDYPTLLIVRYARCVRA